jgi:hypothetical protein
MPDIFYHGTRTAIHRLSPPCLDPACARLDPSTENGLYEGDPHGPHVLLTPFMIEARLFSLRCGAQISNGARAVLEARFFGAAIGQRGNGGGAPGGAHAIYAGKPANLEEPGYVYTLDRKRHGPFLPTDLDGRPTNWWFSRDKLDVTHHPPIVVQGLRELMQEDGVAVFYLRCGRELGRRIVLEGIRVGRRQGYLAQIAFLRQSVRGGRLGDLNADCGHAPAWQ